MANSLKSRFSKMLISKGLKLTKTRKQVLELLVNSEGAVAYSSLQQQLENADRVTIYRTVQTLLENAVVHTAYKEGNETYLALCEVECSAEHHRHHHVHFKCSVCHAVSCVDLSTPIDLRMPGYSVNHINIEASGICKSCNK